MKETIRHLESAIAALLLSQCPEADKMLHALEQCRLELVWFECTSYRTPEMFAEYR